MMTLIPLAWLGVATHGVQFASPTSFEWATRNCRLADVPGMTMVTLVVTNVVILLLGRSMTCSTVICTFSAGGGGFQVNSTARVDAAPSTAAAMIDFVLMLKFGRGYLDVVQVPFHIGITNEPDAGGLGG